MSDTGSGVTIIRTAEAAKRQADALAAGKYIVTERLVRDRETGKVGPEATTSGSLIYTPGMEIPLEEARACGLVSEEPKAEAKTGEPPKTEPKADPEPEPEVESKPEPKAEAEEKSAPRGKGK